MRWRSTEGGATDVPILALFQEGTAVRRTRLVNEPGHDSPSRSRYKAGRNPGLFSCCRRVSDSDQGYSLDQPPSVTLRTHLPITVVAPLVLVVDDFDDALDIYEQYLTF